MDYWQKQTMDSPLYRDMLWSRPETRNGAGKLLIIGGSAHSFASIGQSYQFCSAAGAGVINILLPAALRRTIGSFMENTEFAASNSSGSFSREALAEFLDGSDTSDATLLAGDFGRNSQTALLLETFVNKYEGILVCTKDSIDYFFQSPKLLLDRENSVIVTNFSQLQKLALSANFETPLISSMGIVLLVQALHSFTKRHKAVIVIKEQNNLIVAYNGKVNSSTTDSSVNLWQTEIASKSVVMYMQNPTKPLEAVTSSLLI